MPDSDYIRRCLVLAKKAAGWVAPNPMVGAVLVYQDKIIGEGYHQYYGGKHAEVNCLESVKAEDKPKIARSSLYVNLEPCAHYGKTPPCADLIIKNKIRRVVIGGRDPFDQVNGKGMEKLLNAGVIVDMAEADLETECVDANKRFFTFQTKQRPYIILKWAQTADGFMSMSGNPPSKRFRISNEYSDRVVHKWRSEEAGILVGTNTALCDNPQLTTRLWPGLSPIRLVLDMKLRLPNTLKIFDRQQTTIIFNSIRHTVEHPDNAVALKKQKSVYYYQLKEAGSIVQQIMSALYRLNVQSVLVEGGSTLLQSLVDEKLWDEARIIINEKMRIVQGVSAPVIPGQELLTAYRVLEDRHIIVTNDHATSNSS